jgi:hypothetical protein
MGLDAFPGLSSEIECHIDPSLIRELDAICNYIQKDLLVSVFVSKYSVDLGSCFGIDSSSQK